MGVLLTPLAVRKSVFRQVGGVTEGGTPFLAAVDFSMKVLTRNSQVMSCAKPYN